MMKTLLLLAAFSLPASLAVAQDQPTLDDILGEEQNASEQGQTQDGEGEGEGSEGEDGQGEQPPFERPELSSEPGTIAVLRGLDKVTARTRDFEAPIGEMVEYGALGITVQYCRKRPPEEPPEVFAFVQVVDRRTDGFGIETEGERIFSGWMFASSPALNPLEHPVYDVWVMDCKT